ncbi:MAG: phosphatidate cytidylyltransferase [Rickettsiales bacterium]|jgi:phosphatidate cytidylyltransferase|nr:phosphatidate cytidylyltransferase [Rickettsiales bacterium]
MTEKLKFESKKLPAAAVMLASAAFTLYMGGWWLMGLGIVLGAAMVWEYCRLWSRNPWFDVAAISALWLGYGFCPANFSIFAAGMIMLFGVDILRSVGDERYILPNLAPVYVGLPVLAFMNIVETASTSAVIYLLLITVATDTGGMIFGRWLGGPKLAPSISPNKTWTGFVGGTLLAFVCATAYILCVMWSGNMDMGGNVYGFALASVVLSLAASVGDLFESKVKRIVGVKDSSTLIPGHGGVLDRFDSFLFAVALMPFIL